MVAGRCWKNRRNRLRSNLQNLTHMETVAFKSIPRIIERSIICVIIGNIFNSLFTLGIADRSGRRSPGNVPVPPACWRFCTVTCLTAVHISSNYIITSDCLPLIIKQPRAIPPLMIVPTVPVCVRALRMSCDSNPSGTGTPDENLKI